MFLYKVNNDGLPFEEVSAQWNELIPDFDNRFGLRCAAALADLNDDGKLEMAVGNFVGGLQLFNAEIKVNQSVEELSDEILVYPNPANSTLKVAGKGLRQIKVFDILGQCLIQKNAASEETTFDVNDLVSGVYILQLESNSGRTNYLKFIRE